MKQRTLVQDIRVSGSRTNVWSTGFWPV